MTERNKKPRIRFAEFSSPWEQRSFADFTFAAGKRNKENLNLKPYAVTNDRGFIPQDEAHDEFGYMKDTDRTAYNIVPPQSFAYNPARINVGSIGYYNGEESVIVSSLYEVFQTKEYVDDRFLWHWIKSEQLPRWINKLQEGSVRLYFYYDKLCECHLMLPSLEEQKKIASFFDNVDNLISLHQRKCDQIKTLKKATLQKMFPKEGETVPEIRFPGFVGDWEQRKVGEVSKRVIVGLATSVTPYYRAEGIPILRNLNIKENYLDDTDILFLERSYAEGQVSKQIHTGDVLTVHTGYIGTSCVVPEKYDNCLTFTTLITTTDGSVLQGEFLAQYLNSEIGMSAVQAVTTQGGRQNLNTNDFVKVEIRYPSVVEQDRICKMLRDIDNLITLHQRKCDELKELKKGLLQQMFV